MQDDHTAGIGETLERYLAKKGLKTRLDQASAIDAWPAVVGSQAARVTEPEGVSEDGILFVRVASAAWMQELQLMSPVILRKLGQRGKKIRRIMWRVG